MNKEIKKIIINNNSKLEFKFVGTEIKENIDYKELERLMDVCGEKLVLHHNIIKCVSWIRTILKDFDESYLEIKLIYEKNKQTMIKYVNKHLIFYETNNKDSYCIKYELGKGINLNLYSDEYYDTNKGIALVSNILTEIHALKDVKIVRLVGNDKIICEMYKVFYHENPDFSSKDINIKIQTMISILIEFFIGLQDYDFNLRRSEMPMSLDLYNDINRLIPLGKIESIEDPFKIHEETKQKIEIVGKNIRDYISKKDNPIDELITISTILHASSYSLYYSTNLEDISKFSNRPKQDVESCKKLVKKINEQHLKNN